MAGYYNLTIRMEDTVTGLTVAVKFNNCDKEKVQAGNGDKFVTQVAKILEEAIAEGAVQKDT